MGLRDYLERRKQIRELAKIISKDFELDKRSSHKIAQYIDGHYPWYSQFGTNIYASDVVQQCISRIVNELMKLDMVHVRKNANGEYISVDDHIQKVLDKPNPLMTSVDYKSKLFWNLLLNYNAFSYPMYENGKLKAIYPLQPTYVEWQQDTLGNFYVNFKFSSGYEVTLPYDSVIHLRYKYSVSEYMGGNIEGQPDNKPLLEVLDLNDILLKGVAKSLKMNMSVNAVIKIRTMVNTDAQIQEIKTFEKKLENNESGLLPIDNSSEFIPINKQLAAVDPTTLQYIEKKICRWFGVSIPILDCDYTPEQYEAFYQSTLEPIIKIATEAHTTAVFSNKQSGGYGNKIKFYGLELLFMNMTQRINYLNMLIDTGSGFKNELRFFGGLRPRKEFEGQIAESSNKTNAENNKTDDKNNSNDGEEEKVEEDV